MNFDEGATGMSALEVALEMPDLAAALAEALDRHESANEAAGDGELLRRWSDASGESRAGMLLTTAWGAREHELRADGDYAGQYASELHGYAKNFTGGSEDFHGSSFPMTPLPGRAGALASSIGFDQEEAAFSLKAVLLLLATRRG